MLDDGRVVFRVIKEVHEIDLVIPFAVISETQEVTAHCYLLILMRCIEIVDCQ
jgi:hypothetical protein